MSNFDQTPRYRVLANGAGMMPCQGNDSSTLGVADQGHASVFLELRKGSSGLIPGPIGNNILKTESLESPVIADKPGKTEKRSKSKKKGKIKIQGCRGIDSLLRNAYRAQLDMLSLAAVKANIMISLNGLLISMLIISGSHLMGIDIWFSIPIMIFLVSSSLATVFAVLSARPDISRKKFSPKDFRDDKAHLLIFEEFSDLSEKQYIDAMSHMLEDDQRVYKNMISHVHELGSTADRKYRKLYCAYTVFIGGIILSVMSLLILEGMKWTNHLPPL